MVTTFSRLLKNKLHLADLTAINNNNYTLIWKNILQNLANLVFIMS